MCRILSRSHRHESGSEEQPLGRRLQLAGKILTIWILDNLRAICIEQWPLLIKLVMNLFYRLRFIIFQANAMQHVLFYDKLHYFFSVWLGLACCMEDNCTLIWKLQARIGIRERFATRVFMQPCLGNPSLELHWVRDHPPKSVSKPVDVWLVGVTHYGAFLGYRIWFCSLFQMNRWALLPK